jgi:hypothetical protein
MEGMESAEKCCGNKSEEQSVEREVGGGAGAKSRLGRMRNGWKRVPPDAPLPRVFCLGSCVGPTVIPL